ncbi:hypothetical protein CJ179_30540 [Rhodococcus sp. ACS1]|jgi:hypothetical protein|nr:hypothetical protein CJ179_30540 [Rhodococcus sp. ACS1]
MAVLISTPASASSVPGRPARLAQFLGSAGLGNSGKDGEPGLQPVEVLVAEGIGELRIHGVQV